MLCSSCGHVSLLMSWIFDVMFIASQHHRHTKLYALSVVGACVRIPSCVLRPAKAKICGNSVRPEEGGDGQVISLQRGNSPKSCCPDWRL